MGLIIIGAGSVGQHIVVNRKEYGINEEIVGFLDDDVQKQNSTILGVDVLGGIDLVKDFSGSNLVIGIAIPSIKMAICNKILRVGSFKYPTLISKSAWISEGVRIGEGSIIYPNSSVNYGSSIGKMVVMNMNCALGHHTAIGDFTSLAPGVCTGGHTYIGEGVEMGINSSTIQNVHIGNHAVIGGATMVIKDVGDSQKCKGVPGVNYT